MTTSVTNMDIHDISRTARTYGVKRYYIVTPIREQHELVERILNHWSSETSRANHPDRVEALSLVELAADFDQVFAGITEEEKKKPLVVLTDARRFRTSVSYAEFRKRMQKGGSESQPLVLVFGTGWGISEAFYERADVFLEPIYGPDGEGGYNHLSVRAAVAAILDRLFGK